MNRLLLILAYFTLITGYSSNKGWFSIGGLVLLISGLILLFAVFFNNSKEKPLAKKTMTLLLSFAFFVSVSLSNNLWDYDMNSFISLAMLITRMLLWSALVFATFYLLPKSSKFKFLHEKKFIFLILIAIFTRFLMLKIVIVPEVDIFFNLKYRAMEIMQLRNPYDLSYKYPPNIPASPKHYPYGPLSLLVLVPFNLLGDPRLLIIFSDLGVAYLLYRLLDKEGVIQELIPLIFLYHPQSLFFASLSAIDNVIVMFLALFFYWYKKQKYFLAFLALSFVGGIKHAYMLIYVFVLKFLRPKKVILASLASGSILLASYAIFIIWDFAAFYNNLFSTFASFTKSWIVPASLSIQAFLKKQSDVTPFLNSLNFQPTILFTVIPSALVSIIILFYLPKSLFKLSLAMAISLLTFFLFAPYALFQYYFVVSSLVLIAFCLAK